MRLVCPNCGAQYEVDDRVMPENGRDVQCSNCGHAWFQQPPQSVEDSAVAAQPPQKDDDADSDTLADDIGALVGEDGYDASFDLDQDDEEIADEVAEDDLPDADVSDPDVSDAELPTADLPKTDLPVRELDENVRTILQEEADLELQARHAEQDNLETQSDLGLDDAPATDDDGVKSRIARLRGYDDEIDQPVIADDLKGRDVLPDIEEINSTLDARETDPGNLSPDDPMLETSKTGGFRRGFVSAVVIFCLLAVLYIFAPAMAERFPAAQPALDQYTAVADKVRLGLEELMRSAIGKMQGLIDKPDNG